MPKNKFFLFKRFLSKSFRKLEGMIFILKSVFVAGVAIPFVLFISVIELLVGFIQAFIFTILSALFIGMAVEEHAEH
jgi:F-type H+-transporting ATPase subunit a